MAKFKPYDMIEFDDEIDESKPAPQIKNPKTPNNWRKRFTNKQFLLIASVITICLLAGGAAVAATHHSNPAKNVSRHTSPTKAQKASPVSLTVISPDNMAQVSESSITVMGNVTSGSQVTVDGKAATLSGEEFSATITLAQGSNTITIVATGPNGDKTTKDLTVTYTQLSASTPSISLSGKNVWFIGPTSAEAKLQLSWSVENIDASKGFYVLRSTQPGPTYPGSLLSTDSGGSESYSDIVPLDGTIYYYRVCQIISNNSCGIYSNLVTITAQNTSTGETISTPTINGTTVNWDATNPTKVIDGFGAGGFLLLWSQDPNPTYPSSGTVYTNTQSDIIAFTSTINHDFISGNTYYVRVCENLGGACGSYSNQITVTAP